MKPSQFVIGIDGGGTKTAAVIADVEGNILARHTAGPSNVQIIGAEKAAGVIYSLIRDCCVSAGCTPNNISGTTMGLAGAGRSDDQKRIAQALHRLTLTKKFRLKKVHIESDARIALEGAFNGDPGIVLIAGTGSIAVAKDEAGNIYRTGGWGRILGDEGSGYYIGKEGLKAVCRQYDGRSGPTLLTDSVAKKFRLKTPADIIAAVHNEKFNIASLAPIVLDAAEMGDEASTAIIQQASDELTGLVRALMTKLENNSAGHMDKRIPLSFIGGLIEGETPLTRALRREILASFPNAAIVPPSAPPVVGAVLMALA